MRTRQMTLVAFANSPAIRETKDTGRGEATVRGEQVAHYLHKSPVGRVKPVLFNEPTLLIPKTQPATSPCQGEESQDRILKHCFASSPSLQRVLI